MDPLPPFYDDLAAFRAEAWRRLSEGAETGRSPFHLPALATVDARGNPRLRTVVLREADGDAGTLRFHCDARSDKAREIEAGSRSRSASRFCRIVGLLNLLDNRNQHGRSRMHFFTANQIY